MEDSAAGKGEVSLDRIQLPLRGLQSAGVAAEDGALVEPPGPFDPFVRAHHHLLRP